MVDPWELLLVLAKACTYAATLCAAGGGLFLLYGSGACDPVCLARIRRFVVMLAAVAALVSLAKVVLTAASMSGDAAGMWDADLERLVLQSGEGWALAIRLSGLIILTATATATAGAGVGWGARGMVCGSGALTAATSFAWVGHLHTLPSSGLPMVVLGIHLVGGAFWLGALMPLSIVTRDPDLSRVAATVARFGKAALVVVAALLVAGLALLWALVGDVHAWWRTPYGELLLLKLAVVACLLGAAAFNHLRLTPRLLAEDGRALQTLRRSIRLELMLGLSILIVTAALTTLAGPS